MKRVRIFFQIILVHLVLLFAVGPVLSQEISFNRVPPPEEKPWPWILGMTQDKEGFMWFAGTDGLYRYDGSRISFYRHEPSNSNSISSNRLTSIYADKSGIIWIGSFRGLDRFDPATGNYTHYRYKEKDPASLSNDTVITILEDHEGFLWIGTAEGLNRLDKRTEKFTRFQYQPHDPESLSNNSVNVIYEDKQGVLWIGTGDNFAKNNIISKEGGLNRMDKKTGRFKRFLYDPEDSSSLIDNRVGAIFEDSHGTFWVGTAGDGLHTMDRTSGNFERHRYDPSRPDQLSRPPVNTSFSLADDIIMFITEDANGAIWIGTLMQGLTRYDIKTKKISNYYSDLKQQGGFNDQSGWCAFTSREGVLWISTWQRNIFRVDPLHTNIPHYDVPGPVDAFHEGSNGVLWIASGAWLANISADKQIRNINIIDSFSNIIAIRKGPENKIWLAARGGLFLFDTRTRKLSRYQHDSKDTGSLISDAVLVLCENKAGKLWVGTEEGLDQLDPETGKFIHFRGDLNTLGNLRIINIYQLLEDRQERLWIGTWGFGVIRLDPKTGKFKHYLRGSHISGIFRDSDDALWVGAQDGLYRFDPGSETFLAFTDPQTGKIITKVLSIVEDDQKYLWILTHSFLIRLSPRRDTLKIYGKSFGIKQSKRSEFINAIKTREGEIFFGDEQGGFYAFFPDKLKSNDFPPQISFTNFWLGEESMLSTKDGSLNASLGIAKELRLNHNQDVFSVDYAVMHYSSPENNQHFFKLENYDKNWRQGGTDLRAYYFNVPPGRYVFRIKAASHTGVWAEKNITIIIDPPWWRTWWAYSIYGLFLIGILYALYLFQKNRLIRREQEKAKAKELEHAKEIEKAYKELEKTLTDLRTTQQQLIQSEKMASLGELTAGIAHEIQNPLNFVNNFSEVNKELLVEMKEEMDKGNVDEAKTIANDVIENQERINHHGKRADAIVKGMLQHSRSSSGVKEPTDINALADEYLRLAYHGLRAKDKSFNATMKTDFDESIGNINIIPQDIGRVILNLITNSFYAVTEKKKQASDGYDPVVSVSTKKSKDKVEIKIKDNGNGIPQKVLDKIFQPFFTTKPTGQGTGLGLSLSYDIVKAHAGEIKVETKEGEGSEFIIRLPMKENV
ncbi:sensor histidine kinase [Terrimonas pollutisoli]|uniref:sensor histidine kinase n=1 Tax=Terrimonas pollutisoli TaxID=3034147 RepID=UPI0023EB17AC|nr:two-component regulator propeller domain-containing protein [Terrimonas sp. H1YJ31]